MEKSTVARSCHSPMSHPGLRRAATWGLLSPRLGAAPGCGGPLPEDDSPMEEAVASSSEALGGAPVPNTTFGMQIKRADTTTAWPSVGFGAWRLWDAHVSWSRL